MKRLICMIVLAFLSTSISAVADQPVITPFGPKQGDWELIRIENRTQFYVEAFFSAHYICLQPGEATIIRKGPSGWFGQSFGQFYFTASAYAMNSEGRREFVGQQTFYFYLDGNARPYYNGQYYEYYGAVVIMSYFPVASYGGPTRSYSGPTSWQGALGPLCLTVNVDVWGSYPRRDYYPRTYMTQEVLVWRGGRNGNYYPRKYPPRKGAEYYNRYDRGYYGWRN